MRRAPARRARWIALHKPYGVLSQFTGEAGQRTLAGFGLPPGVYAAGRLDRDSEGLLLLTDDGPAKARLLDPEHSHPRTYLAQVEGIPDEAALARLRQGVEIGGYVTRPAAARAVPDPGLPPRDPPIRWRAAIPTGWIELTLTEGRNRQVRRMTAAVGFPTLRLVRTAIADIGLGDLAPGEWREVARPALSGYSAARTSRP